MLYPENIETKIGFDTIREILGEYCLGPLGVVSLTKIAFSSEPKTINQALDRTSEFTQILTQKLVYPRSGYLDCSESLDRIPIDGMFLGREEFYHLRVSIGTMIDWSVFLKKNAEAFPGLNELGKLIDLEKQLPQSIDSVIDKKGLVKDGASSELKKIRQDILSKKRKARSAVGRFLKQCIQSNFSKSDATVSIRNGRLVIPVIAQHKRSIQGFIHDESSTGQTSYIEPAEVLSMNNEITDLEYQERREIVRILTRLTTQIRPYLPDLQAGFQFLGEIDCIQCKARLARQLEATKPQIVPGQIIELKGARHPLLFLTYRKQKKEIVPLDLSMSADQRILVISGPNAGGKSVCLKTVALLQYMLQCGLLVPVEEGSSMGIFEDIFIDIGDEQSIENDLSTYSSHIRNMNFLIQNLTRDSLFLIDEFGTGTDPQFGGSIAEAVLEELNDKGGVGIVTTHYSNLKKMAGETRGIANAAMRPTLSLPSSNLSTL